MKTITDNFKMIEFNNAHIHKTITGLSYAVIENNYSDPFELIKMISNGSLDLIESKKDKKYNKTYYGKIFIDRNIGRYMRSKFINKLISNQLCDSDLNIIQYYRAEIIFKYNQNHCYYLNNNNTNHKILFDDKIWYTTLILPADQHEWFNHLYSYYLNMEMEEYSRHYQITKDTLFQSQSEIIKNIKEMSDASINTIHKINVVPISNYDWI